jgi:hypothetical protein
MSAETPSKKLNILMRSGWGTDDPTRGSFVFAHALAFADAGHDVRIFLTGDLSNWNAKWGTPAIFVSLVEWADRVISE